MHQFSDWRFVLIGSVYIQNVRTVTEFFPVIQEAAFHRIQCVAFADDIVFRNEDNVCFRKHLYIFPLIEKM